MRRSLHGLWAYTSLWSVVFVVTTGFLMAFHLAPPELTETGEFVLASALTAKTGLMPLPAVSRSVQAPDTSALAVSTSTPKEEIPAVEPVKIAIYKIGLDSVVINPKDNSEAVLDEALTEGVVRYPGSGDLLSKKNIFLFGHSSYLPVVHNQAYKVFNGLSSLNLGDEIMLSSLKTEYIYKVVKVEVVGAEEAIVKFDGDNKRLILSTCDSFGKKTDRFVVEAEFVASRPI